MTPKEKAEELFMRFLDRITISASVGYQEDYMRAAKQCALVMINEILNGSQIWNKIEGDNRVFWNKVKIEIEKL